VVREVCERISLRDDWAHKCDRVIEEHAQGLDVVGESGLQSLGRRELIEILEPIN
jgi:hypothetical protein